MLGRSRRIALLAEGSFTPADAKTAVGVLRWRPEEVVAVIDSTRAGPIGVQTMLKLADPNTVYILDSWLYSNGTPGGNAAAKLATALPF